MVNYFQVVQTGMETRPLKRQVTRNQPLFSTHRNWTKPSDNFPQERPPAVYFLRKISNILKLWQRILRGSSTKILGIPKYFSWESHLKHKISKGKHDLDANFDKFSACGAPKDTKPYKTTIVCLGPTKVEDFENPNKNTDYLHNFKAAGVQAIAARWLQGVSHPSSVEGAGIWKEPSFPMNTSTLKSKTTILLTVWPISHSEGLWPPPQPQRQARVAEGDSRRNG